MGGMRRLVVFLCAVGCATSNEDTTARPTDVCQRTYVGRVTLAVDAEPIVQSRATAVFTDTTASSQAPRCTTKTVAGCTVTECVRADPTRGPQLPGGHPYDGRRLHLRQRWREIRLVDDLRCEAWLRRVLDRRTALGAGGCADPLGRGW